MTALELHRQNPSLDLAPILRVIKYMGFDSNSLSEAEVERILTMYPHFERDPELVVGVDAVGRLTELEADRLSELLGKHRHEIPYLGTTAHPMVPKVAIEMIRALAAGEDPMPSDQEELFTLTEMAEKTDISLASLSKYVKEQPERIPSRTVGRMRKFPQEAVSVFRQIKAENLGRRGNGREGARRQKAALSRRYAVKLADLEEQLDAAVEVARDLSRTLNRLSRQVSRARNAAESESKPTSGKEPRRARRSGGKRPDTIVAACKQVLENADEPMRVADITERVIAMGTPIKAKNPNVTVSSILSSYDDFHRVRRGYYELVRSTDPGDPEPPAEDASPPAAAEASTVDKAVTTTIDRDPQDILAGLQAAAESAEGESSGRQAGAPSRRRSRRQDDRVVRLEPSEAAG